MSEHSSIEWTDATWNPTTGCDRISPGCAKCYAKTVHDKRHKAFLAGWTAAPRQYHQPFEVVQTRDDRLELPLRWREPRRIFVDSMSDLFHKNVPDAFIDKVFAVMALAPRHTFQILTKRADRMLAYVLSLRGDGGYNRLEAAARDLGYSLRFQSIPMVPWPIPNVWLGVSVENQRFADKRIPLLLQTPAAIRFISAEPLLGPIDLNALPDPKGDPSWDASALHGLRECAFGATVQREKINALDLVIVGGESDKNARAFDLAWPRAIVQQCHAAGVAAFVKQLGSMPVMQASAWRAMNPKPLLSARNHRKVSPDVVPLQFYAKKAGSPEEWPEDLRVREFPPAVRA